ncbi:outer membrane lipoprotein-sorting protein [Magnetofaba australis]|uniref:outer membrane lipoprotein-sorting protein n=1 Tax=Magnetofaba australis TaxID=1472297 RepID=UPI001301E9F6|nr:outer membrane lipoprotein-sorting protein [Magnetofaba australis]
MRILWLAVLFAGLVQPGAAQAQQQDFDVDVVDLLKRIDANLFPASGQLFIRIHNETPRGPGVETSLYAARDGGERWAALIAAPASLKGRTLMRQGDEMRVRLPGELGYRHQGWVDSFVGGSFGNVDLFPEPWSDAFDAVVQGRAGPLANLVLTPKDAGRFPFKRLTAVVDVKLAVPIEVRQFGSGNRLIKILHYKDPVPFPYGHTRPRVVEAINGLNTGYSSIMEYGDIVDRAFTEADLAFENLPRVGVLLK